MYSRISFNTAPNDLAFLIVWHLRRVVPRVGVLLSLTSVMHSMIIEKAKPSYDEMKITDKYTFSEGRPRNCKELTAGGDSQMEY